MSHPLRYTLIQTGAHCIILQSVTNDFDPESDAYKAMKCLIDGQHLPDICYTVDYSAGMGDKGQEIGYISVDHLDQSGFKDILIQVVAKTLGEDGKDLAGMNGEDFLHLESDNEI